MWEGTAMVPRHFLRGSIVTPLLTLAGIVFPLSAGEPPPPARSRWIRGDASVGTFLGLEDVITIAGHLFLGDPKHLECDDAADANDDGQVDIGDAISLLFYLFEGDQPPEPFPACGEDPTEDGLGCDSFWICGTGAVINSVEMRLLPVRAGAFEMGSPASERGRSRDEVLHTVVISCDFYLSETEVTQGQYLAVMGENPSSANGLDIASQKNWGTDLTRAVETVTWWNATEFCRRLSMMEGRQFRLPYEAEWEYACRSGTRTRFWFGDVLECNDTCVCVCPPATPYMWFEADGTKMGFGIPVGRKLPNPWGFHDIHGHVGEWCQDWYGPYPEGVLVDPRGPSEGTRKVIRGGGDAPFGLHLSRSGRRDSGTPDAWGLSLGFRLVLELPACAYGD
jgi:formylglycine-generating enzyme required for sulfatase activity